MHPKVTVELVCVCIAERPPVLTEPFDEGDVSERAMTRGQQPGGQAANLVGREDDVAYDEAECSRERCHRGRRCVQDRRTSTDGVANDSNELLERHRVRPGRVHDLVAATVRGL